MYKILIADDESIERKVLGKSLAKFFGDSIEIYEARTGREAIEIFEEEGIRIAILDIEMPGIDGLEAARYMSQKDSNCVIIFLTAYDDFSYARQAIRVKALDYLLKPYDEEELYMTVEEAMRLVDQHYKTMEEDKADEEELVETEDSDDIRFSLLKEKVESYISEHFTEEISMHDIAHVMNYSESYFCKLFKQCFKVNFTTYLANHRIEKAKSMLEDPLTNIKVVGISCGYPDSNYFARVFKRATGLTPTEYRKKKINEKWTKLS